MSIVLALAAAVGCPLLAWGVTSLLVGLDQGAQDLTRLTMASLAALTGLTIGLLARKQGRKPSWTNLVLGAALAAGATWSFAPAMTDLRRTGDASNIPVFELADAPLPDGATGVVTVRGYLRSEMVLDEYRVAAGDRPDQNQAAPAKLVPLLGTRDDTITADGRVVVARVPGDLPMTGAPREFTGVLAPLPRGTFDALFAVAPEVDAAALEGVMLDTIAAPTRQGAWTATFLALGAALLAGVLLLTASTPPSPDERS